MVIEMKKIFLLTIKIKWNRKKMRINEEEKKGQRKTNVKRSDKKNQCNKFECGFVYLLFPTFVKSY
jgi:hypothetical protein